MREDVTVPVASVPREPFGEWMPIIAIIMAMIVTFPALAEEAEMTTPMMTHRPRNFLYTPKQH
jgi:hypothetical protein